MKTGSDIIETYAPTPAMNALVRKLIKQLITMAKEKQPSKTYGELSRSIGYNSNQIGRALGAVYDIINAAGSELSISIPTVNGLCHLKKTGLPAARFDIHIPDYDNLSIEQKRIEVDRINKEAYNYKEWDKVLKFLDLIN